MGIGDGVLAISASSGWLSGVGDDEGAVYVFGLPSDNRNPKRGNAQLVGNATML